jgi:hypothetical protein
MTELSLIEFKEIFDLNRKKQLKFSVILLVFGLIILPLNFILESSSIFFTYLPNFFLFITISGLLGLLLYFLYRYWFTDYQKNFEGYKELSFLFNFIFVAFCIWILIAMTAEIYEFLLLDSLGLGHQGFGGNLLDVIPMMILILSILYNTDAFLFKKNLGKLFGKNLKLYFILIVTGYLLILIIFISIIFLF